MPIALVFGARGQLGRAVQACVPDGWKLHAIDSSQVDLRDEDRIRAVIHEAAPQIVLNCAAYTRVDDAESDEVAATLINGTAPGVMARECRAAGARLIHVSTDYVFDGAARSPYAVDALPAPINVYGASKLMGEREALARDPATTVVRTAWVHSGRPGNFIATVVRVLCGGTSMRVVDDQVGTPTRALHLAQALWRAAERPHMGGVWHFTDAGVASWYDVALAAREHLVSVGACDPATTVDPVGTDAFPRPARRPPCVILDKRSSWARLDWRPTHWRTGVIASITEILSNA